jgi:serine/threonine protein kinase
VRDVAAALQRYWDRRGEDGVSLESELAHIARLPADVVERMRVEVERIVREAHGDPFVALTRRGGLDRSVHLALGKQGANVTHALSVLGVPVRAPLRTLPPERYVDFDPAGVGGMGVIYAALDTEMNRRVAFKMVRTDAGGSEHETPSSPLEAERPPKDSPGSHSFEELKARLVQEAWVTGGLEHPGIVPVYEIGQTASGIPYYTMRFVRGERTLADAIDEKRKGPFETRLPLLEVFLKVCDAVRYAHDKGVVHRDLKPHNVALGSYGEVVLLDWGLARLEGREDVAATAWRRRVEEVRAEAGFHTLEGGALGTAGYMAPEATLGRVAEMDRRSDVYGLGAMLYEILTGRLPYEFASYSEFASLQARADPQPADAVDPSVPKALAALCVRALAREKAARPDSARAIAEAVRAWQAQDAVDREVGGLLRDAGSALESAEGLAGEARLTQVDRAAAALAQVEAKRPEQEEIAGLRARAAALREEGTRQRERAATRRTLVRGGVAAAVLAAVAGLVVAGVVEERRREAEGARRDAQAATAAAERESDAKGRALRRTRALALVSASRGVERSDPVLALLLARRARPLAGADDATTVSQVHSAVAGTRERLRLAHPDSVLDAAYSKDGDRILTACDDGKARLWNGSGRLLAELPHAAGKGVNGASFLAEGGVLTWSDDGTARLWDAQGKQTALLDGKGGSVTESVLSRDERFVLTSSSDWTIRLWDRSGVPLASLGPHEGRIREAAFSPSGERVLAVSDVDESTSWWDRRLRLWRLRGGVAEPVQLPGTPSGGVFAPDSDRLLSWEGTTAALTSPDGGTRTLAGHVSDIRGGGFSPKGDEIVTWGDRELLWWDA